MNRGCQDLSERARRAGPGLAAALAVVAACAVTAGPGAARADRIIDTASDLAAEALAVRESVTRRPRPDYGPIGIPLGRIFSPLDTHDLPMYGERRAGGSAGPVLQPLADGERAYAPFRGDDGRDGWLDSLLLLPRLDLGVQYDDNILRTEQNELDDIIYRVIPGLDIRSEWANHGVAVTGYVDLGRYKDNSSQDFTDYLVRFAPRFDIGAHNRLGLSFDAANVHVPRGTTENTLEGLEPARDLRANAFVDWRYKADKVASRVRYRFQRVNAENTADVTRDQFDRNVQNLSWRGGYEFAPGTYAWVQPNFSGAEFRESSDDDGFNRDNRGYSVLVGLTYDASAVGFMDVGIGYLFRTFDQPEIEDFDSIDGEARLLWNATNLISLELAAGRTTRIVESRTSSASIDDSIKLEVAWDPLENLILDASIGYTDSDYRSLPGFPRQEEFVTGRIGLRYLANDYIALDAGYDYSARESNIEFDDYDNNVLSLRVRIRL